MKLRLLLLLLAGLMPLAASAVPLGCLVTPEKVAEIGTPVAGVLASVAVERGDRIHKGQVLAVISSAVEQAGVDVARTRAKSAAEVSAGRASLELARQRYERSVDLHRRAFVSKQALDQAEAEFKVAEQKLAQSLDQQQINERELQMARAQLGQRQLRAPFDGVVIDRLAHPGERVEDRPLMRIASIDVLRAEVVVPAAQFGALSAGMPAWLTPGLPEASPVPATITLVDAVIDPASNTFRVRLSLENADHKVPAGVRCKVDFNMPTEAAAPRPRRAVPSTQAPASAPAAEPASGTAPATATAGIRRASMRSGEFLADDGAAALREATGRIGTDPQARPDVIRIEVDRLEVPRESARFRSGRISPAPAVAVTAQPQAATPLTSARPEFTLDYGLSVHPRRK